MSEFQKEAAVAAVLCLFLFACFYYAATAHTEQAAGKRAAVTVKTENDLHTENCSF